VAPQRLSEPALLTNNVRIKRRSGLIWREQ